MRIALVKNGPLAVSFQVYDDFLNYKGGIYHHTNQKDIRNFKFNPWEVTNHVGNTLGFYNFFKGIFFQTILLSKDVEFNEKLHDI